MRRKRGPNRKKHVKHTAINKRAPKLPKRKRNRRIRFCPVHSVALVHLHAEKGLLWKCPEPRCTVSCGAGPTSSPADSRTHFERGRTHELFDPLWRRGPNKRFARRDGAYQWLAKVMGLTEAKCHIGMMDLEQCRRAQGAIRKLLKGNLC